MVPNKKVDKKQPAKSKKSATKKSDKQIHYENGNNKIKKTIKKRHKRNKKTVQEKERIKKKTKTKAT